MPDDVSSSELSDIISVIYDCAVDPARWPAAIREVCGASRCAAGLIAVHDLQRGSALLSHVWNYDPDWIAGIERYSAEITEIWRSVPNLHARPLDEPLTMSDVPAKLLEASRYWKEWVRPQGYIDTIQLIVLRTRQRIGALGLSRHEAEGPLTNRDLEVMRLLAPHLQRAVTISNALEMQTVALGTFEASLDLLLTGVLLVDRECVIIHANTSARAMLRAGSPIRSKHGELRTCFPVATAALKAMVAAATDEATALGRSAVGLPAPQPNGGPAFLHILPLTQGEVRGRIAPRAAAAVFVMPGADGSPLPAHALAALFGLTRGETRTLEILLAGNDIAATAEKLGVVVATVKTHLSRIFAKTGASDQIELTRLAYKFVPPVGRAEPL
jgi:DNA-binding CsgD family transcriptional regulator